MEDNFYIVLPSNISTNYFPDNTISNYTTKLASRLLFKDKWEVGLVEMSYTPSWYNITKTLEVSLWYYDDDSTSYGFSKKVYLKPGCFNNINELLDEINYLIKSYLSEISYETTEKPRFSVIDRTKLVMVKHGVKKGKLFLVIPDEDLCQILGLSYINFYSYIYSLQEHYKNIELKNQSDDLDFEVKKHKILNNSNEYKKIKDTYNNDITEFERKTQELLDKDPDYSEAKQALNDNKILSSKKLMEIINISREYMAEYPFDLSGGNHSLFVYCDIVKPSFIGDSFTQLLRLVEISPNITFGKQECIKYSNVYYVPLLVQEFETIEIDIKSDTGDQIPFTHGRSIIVLHFRKKDINKR